MLLVLIATPHARHWQVSPPSIAQTSSSKCATGSFRVSIIAGTFPYKNGLTVNPILELAVETRGQLHSSLSIQISQLLLRAW